MRPITFQEPCWFCFACLQVISVQCGRNLVNPVQQKSTYKGLSCFKWRLTQYINSNSINMSDGCQFVKRLHIRSNAATLIKLTAILRSCNNKTILKISVCGIIFWSFWINGVFFCPGQFFKKITNSTYTNCFRASINFILKSGMSGSLKKNITAFEKNKLIKEIFITGLHYIFTSTVSEMNGNNLQLLVSVILVKIYQHSMAFWICWNENNILCNISMHVNTVKQMAKRKHKYCQFKLYIKLSDI